MIITPQLVAAILQEYTLPWYGTHGVTHWARVLENGRRLAADSGASLAVVELFAVFHDSRRVNERRDFGHGLRGAKFAATLRGRLFDLPDAEFDDLYTACAEHTDGKTRANPNIRACWDSDRLDLYRVGSLPEPHRLCTDAARQPALLAWANDRARYRFAPDLLRSEWGLDGAPSAGIGG